MSRIRKSSVGFLPKGLNIDVPKTVAMGGGALAAKAVNPMINRIVAQYIPQNDPSTATQEGKVARLLIYGGKLFIGGYISKNFGRRNGMVKDAALGWNTMTGLEIINELFPNLNISGMLDDFESVGNVVEIDLDNNEIKALSGNRIISDNLEDYQDVAGITDHYIDDSMELAGHEVM